jgi:glycosyltransferase involved in cell wall biosynthesis
MEDSDGTDVLVVTQFFSPEGIGGGYRWERFSDHLPADYDCRILCPPPTYPFGEFDRTFRPLQWETRDDLAVTRLWTYQPASDSRADDANLGRMLNYGVFSVLASLYVLFNFWRYDTVVTMSTPHTTFLPGIVAKLLGRRWVVDVFDLWADNAEDFGYADADSFVLQFVRWLERTAMTRSDRVVVITETMADHFRDRYGVGEKVLVVPFGVDEDLFEPTPEAERDPRAIYTGSFGDAQAFVPFVRGLANVDDDFDLLLIGTGKRRDELEALVREEGLTDRVEFHGVVSREEIPGLLAGSTLSFVPLRTDQQLDYARPTKLLESMAVGTPFVASAVSEMSWVAEESGGGIAVENDPEEVASAIRDIRQGNPAEMGENAVEFIDAHHRWPVLADRVADALRA